MNNMNDETLRQVQKCVSIHVHWQVYAFLNFVLYLAQLRSVTVTACNCRQSYIFEAHVTVFTSEKENKYRSESKINHTFSLLINWQTEVQDDIINILFCFFQQLNTCKNKIMDSKLLLYICSTVDHRKHQNGVRTSVGKLGYSLVSHFCDLTAF